MFRRGKLHLLPHNLPGAERARIAAEKLRQQNGHADQDHGQ
jgi:hypothetical protein